MTQAERQEFNDVSGKLTEFEEATVQAVAEIDECDGSRIGLQQTLDSVRETLANCYGENFPDALDEYLGIEVEIDEETSEEEEFEEV